MTDINFIHSKFHRSDKFTFYRVLVGGSRRGAPSLSAGLPPALGAPYFPFLLKAGRAVANKKRYHEFGAEANAIDLSPGLDWFICLRTAP